MINKSIISPYKNYCNGFSEIGNIQSSYIVGISLGIGINNIEFPMHKISVLDQTIAFDLAEIDGPYLGQLNMIKVSSFCGSQGRIWGYDLVSNEKNKCSFEFLDNDKIYYKNKELEVHDGYFLVNALERLFGTVENKKYIIRPGAHVPFASKSIFVSKPSIIYSAIGIAIPKNRIKNACLLMEDVGTIKSIDDKQNIIINLAKSVINIGINQNIEYEKCFIVLKTGKVKQKQIGCALVAAPYFTIAKDAIPDNNINMLLDMDLSNWEQYMNHKKNKDK